MNESRHIIHDAETAGVSAEEFKAAFRHHPAGVAVITADDGTGPVAMTVTSVFSVSAEPPVLVFSISDFSSAAPTMRSADTLVVHLLAPRNKDLAVLASSHGADRFGESVRWGRLPTGEPYYLDPPTWIRGKIVDELTIGTSTVVAVHVLEVKLPEGDDANVGLGYFNRTWHEISEDSRID